MHVIDEVGEDFTLTPTGEGSARYGYTTYTEPINSPLAEGIWRHIHRLYPASEYARVAGKPLEITVAHCWAGYSPYTITSMWDEVEINWAGYYLWFASVSAFFRDIAGI